MPLRVDPVRCHAHGLCAELLPELVELDEWGYPLLDPGEMPPELEAAARRAASACPTLALRIERPVIAVPAPRAGGRPADARPRRRG
jgi:ferredoxin